MPKTESMLAWALRYAALGWYVFPLRTSGDLKRPHGMLGGVNEGSGHLKATTNPALIRKWWGAAPTAGIALSLSKSGLMALDEDPRDDGPAKRIALEARFGWVQTDVRQISGSGGRHYLFVAPGDTRFPGKLLGRKGLDLKHEGYIVLAPSPHSAKGDDGVYRPTGGFYRWEEGADPFENLPFLTTFPEWFLLRDTAPAVAGAKTDSDDVFAEDAQKAGLSIDQIEELLRLVHNEDGDGHDYDTWLAILAGIWHETDGSVEGERLARSWSEQSLKHDPEKFNRTWKSLDHRGSGRAPTTIRLLIKLASAVKTEQSALALADFLTRVGDAKNQTEFRAVCAEIKKTELDKLDRLNLTAEVQKAYKRITGNAMPIGDARSLTRYEDPRANDMPDWLKPWVYLSNEDLFMKLGTVLALTKPAFDNTFNRHMLTLEEIRSGVAYPENSASNAALNRYQIPRADRRMYLPGEDGTFTMNGISYFNTYSSLSQPPVPATLSASDRRCMKRLDDHFRFMVPNDRERGILISWFSYIVKEQRRPNWAIVMQSLEGEGKTFLQELFGAILGAENVKVLDPKIISGNFTGWAGGHLLKIVEEIKLHGQHRFEILDNIKAFITNKTINIHAKRMEGVDVVNTAAYLMFTNYRDALPIGEGDTRYFMLASPRQTPEDLEAFREANPTYFADLYAIINEAPGALRRYFLDYPRHPEFSANGRAPHSLEKQYVQYINKAESQIAIEELIENSLSISLTYTLFDTTAMFDQLSDDDVRPNTRAVEAVLSRMGFTALGRFKVGERKHRYWSRKPARFGKFQEPETGQRIRDYLDQNSVDDL